MHLILYSHLYFEETGWPSKAFLCILIYNYCSKTYHRLGSVHWHPGDPQVASAPFEDDDYDDGDNFADDDDFDDDDSEDDNKVIHMSPRHLLKSIICW